MALFSQSRAQFLFRQKIANDKKLELNASIGGIPDQTAKKKYKPPRSRSLRWAVTEGDGDGDGEITRFVSRTLIHQIVSVSGFLQ